MPKLLLLTLQRKSQSPTATTGVLSAAITGFDGEQLSKPVYTLEDTVRASGVKVAGETAISPGLYELRLTFSPHFGRFLPELIDVPMFTDIRLHGGNTVADTKGCPLMGLGMDGEKIWNCRPAEDMIIELMKACDIAYIHILSGEKS